ncbi:MAG: circularly permuted type 2 ATP-grasp protein, partial [Pseudomonadota bacterium]
QIQVLPVPLVLEAADYRRVQRGVEQRARAFKAFFEDVVLGEGRIYDEIPELNADLVDMAFQGEGYSLTYLRSIWSKRDISAYSIFYGPDLIRGADGKWYVLEDNFGNIGGTADMNAVNNLMRSTIGAVPNAVTHLEKTIEAFLNSHNLGAADREVLAITYRDKPKGPVWTRPKDIEDERRFEVLKKMGFRNIVLADASKEEWEGHMKKQWKAVVNLAHPNFDDDYRMFRAYEADFFGNSETPFFRAPGASVVGSKFFSMYAARFIRFYLNQRPILKTPKAQVLNPNSVRRAPEKWVVKSIDGQQGSSVKVLNRSTQPEIDYVLTLGEDWQSFYERNRGMVGFPKWIQQRYIEPSYIPAGVPDSWERFSVDIRPISLVFDGGVVTPSAPWGRSVSKTSSGLNNVSRGAFELGVMVVNSCAGELLY